MFHRRAGLGSAVEGVLLFDETGELEVEPPEPVTLGEPWFPLETVQWFFYMLGKLATVVGRNDPVLGVQGVTTILYTCVVPLFLAERGAVRVGGAKRLRPFLSAEQHAALEALPPLEHSLESVIAGELALASIFVPRARALAERLGAAWPAALERATLAYLSEQLGRPVGPF